MFNVYSKIEKCLFSICTQTYRNIEIIVIDDCSSDQSLEIVKALQKSDQRISIIENKKNFLAGKTRNIGLKHANGDYVWFVDSDDWIENDSLEYLVKKIQSTASGLDFCHFGFYYHYDESLKCPKINLPYHEEICSNPFVAFLTIKNLFYSMPTIYLFSREFLNRFNILFTENTYYEDIMFLAKASHYAVKVKSFSKALYNHDKTEHSSITQTPSEKKVFDLLSAYEQLKDFMSEKNVFYKYNDLFVFRFLLFGLPKCFHNYFALKEKGLNSEILRKELSSYLDSELMSNENIRYLYEYVISLDDREYNSKKEYLKNLYFIQYVKNCKFI